MINIIEYWWITGEQLGILKSGGNINKMVTLNDIEDDQFIGRIEDDKKPKKKIAIIDK